MTNIFSLVAHEIHQFTRILYQKFSWHDKVTVEVPHNREYGDLATNAALIIGRELNLSPKEVALALSDKLQSLDYIAKTSVAGAGFINIEFTAAFWQNFLIEAHKLERSYGFEQADIGRNINLEFVSVNPTGPMHVGHARGAVYGDAISNILRALGHKVTKEYYVNDAGSQIATLVESMKMRHRNLLGESLEIPSGCYPGEYVIDLAIKAKSIFGNNLEEIEYRTLADFAVEEIMQIIKQDLANLGVIHDIFVSEYHDVSKKDQINGAIKLLEEKNLIYKGILAAPKSGECVDWEPKEQTIFRSTDFGDELDRAVIKSDGSYTYFLGDIVYHYNKIARGFNEMILLLGADHSGYVKRMKAVVSALSDNKATIDIKISQLVNLYKDGKPFKMSKRTGNFISIKEVIEEVGRDAFKFAILTKKSDTVLDIDFSKLREQSKDNPFFYVQYANTRANSVLKRAKELNMTFQNDLELDMKGRIFPEDMELIRTISAFPKIVQASATSYEPHRINYYLQELSTQFHQLWALGSKKHQLRFINETKVDSCQGRLILASLVRSIISESLRLLGITALTEM